MAMISEMLSTMPAVKAGENRAGKVRAGKAKADMVFSQGAAPDGVRASMDESVHVITK
jgi:hypothetical protein